MAIAIGLTLLAPGALQAAGIHGPGRAEGTDDARPVATPDPGFGNGGLLQFPAEGAETALGAAAEDGSLVVSGGASMQLLGPTGGPGEVFGGVGSLAVPAVAGRTLALGGFTVDRQGRLLVVGSSLYPPDENPSPEREGGTLAFEPAALRILRLLPGGGLDPSFGQGGVVETGLGLAPPRGTDGRRLGSHPSLLPSAVAVDPQGHIIVTGAAAVRLGETCKPDSFAAAAVDAGFVARFTEGGATDAGFGRDGLFGGRALSENPLGAEGIGEPLAGPGGGITYLSTGAYACRRDRSHLGVAQLTPRGQTRKAFGRKEAVVGLYRALTEEPDGSVVALAEVPRRREGESFRAQVIRVAPDGRRDRTFGKGGRATVRLGPGFSTTLDSVVVDGRGRIVVGGTLGSSEGRSIVLLRLSARGRREASFGPHGRVATKVSLLAPFGASDLFFDPQGRLVTVHQYAEPSKGRSGLVVARYLLRN